MPRSMSVSMLYVRAPRKTKNNPRRRVDKLPVQPDDLLQIITAAMEAQKPDDLVDKENKRYVRITDVCAAQGHPRVLQVTAEVGRFGESGRNRNVETHAETHVHGVDEAPVSEIRVIFVVPEHADMAVMFSERSHPYSAGGAIRGALQAYWLSHTWSSDWSLHADVALNVPAWLKTAQVNEVQAISYGHTTDYEGLSDGLGKELGDLTMVLRPKKGSGHLSRRLWDLLRANPADRASILGLANVSDEIQEVTIQVEGENGQVKTFSIDKQKAPSVRLTLTDLEGDPGLPNHLVSRVIHECPEIYKSVGLDWHSV